MNVDYKGIAKCTLIIWHLSGDTEALNALTVTVQVNLLAGQHTLLGALS